MAAAPFVKVIQEGSELSVHATDATARVIYRVELKGNGPFSPDAMRAAVNQLPRIGSRSFGTILGAPTGNSASTTNNTFAVHDLRVSNHVARTIKSENGQMHYIDCMYASRPRPTIERGASASQQKTSTYLFAGASGGYAYTSREQMVLDWTAPIGIFSGMTPPKGISLEPPVETPFLKTPVSGTRMEFGSSVRLASTWYADEISQQAIDRVSFIYGTAINWFPLFYGGISGFDDSRKWLCASVGSVSHDGGWSNRISGEFVFNPQGWDTQAVYTLPYSDQPAILKSEVLQGLYNGLAKNARIPPPYVPPGGGAGRWPQQVAGNLALLVGFLSQGVLAPLPTVDQLLTNY